MIGYSDPPGHDEGARIGSQVLRIILSVAALGVMWSVSQHAARACQHGRDGLAACVATDDVPLIALRRCASVWPQSRPACVERVMRTYQTVRSVEDGSGR